MNEPASMRNHGFTLMEIMVVVVIVGILAAVAIPGYLEYVKRSRRSEAMAAVQAVITGLEKYYLSNNGYTTDFSELSINGVVLVASGSVMLTESRNYGLSISQVGGLYTVEAKAVSGQSQASDDDCQSFTMNTAGQRSASDSNGADSTAACWRQ